MNDLGRNNQNCKYVASWLWVGGRVVGRCELNLTKKSLVGTKKLFNENKKFGSGKGWMDKWDPKTICP